MRTININKDLSHELASKEAALTLLKDGTIVYPTDTLYGLGANALNSFAVEKIFKVKNRSPQKPLPVIVGSIDMARAFALIDRTRESVLKQIWPGPYTVVFTKKGIVPDELTGGGRTIAMRVPESDFCKSLLKDFEGPIVATSANISGEDPLSTAREIEKRFKKEKEKPDLIVDAGFLPSENPSTIIDLTSVVPQILRVNPTTKDKVLEILNTLSS